MALTRTYFSRVFSARLILAAALSIALGLTPGFSALAAQEKTVPAQTVPRASSTAAAGQARPQAAAASSPAKDVIVAVPTGSAAKTDGSKTGPAPQSAASSQAAKSSPAPQSAASAQKPSSTAKIASANAKTQTPARSGPSSSASPKAVKTQQSGSQAGGKKQAAAKSASKTKAVTAKAPAKNSTSGKGATQARQGSSSSKANASRYNVKAAITMDLTSKRIVFQQNPDTRIAPASLTKVLSMCVVLDQVKAKKVSLNDQVTVSAKAAGTGGSRMVLRAGEKVRLRDLLKGMAIASGNDAAVAVAQHVAGSEAAFVKMMNTKARAVGMKNSVFKNVHGLPAQGQLTTARDMLALTRHYITAHPDAVAQFHTPRYLEHRGVTANTNPLLDMDGVDGLKTGFVNASGYNLITTAKRGNTRLVNVLLGAQSKPVRLKEATRMVENGFATATRLAEADKAKSGGRQASTPAKAAGGQKQAAAPAMPASQGHAAASISASGG